MGNLPEAWSQRASASQIVNEDEFTRIHMSWYTVKQSPKNFRLAAPQRVFKLPLSEGWLV